MVTVGYVLGYGALCAIQYEDISMHICLVFAFCYWMTKVRPPRYHDAPIRRHFRVFMFHVTEFILLI